MQIDYTPQINEFFQYFGFFDFNFLPRLVSRTKHWMPSETGFERNQLDSYFLRNSGQYLILFLGLLLLHLAVKILLHICPPTQTALKPLLTQLRAKLEWGFYLCLAQVAFLNLCVFSILQLRNNATKHSSQTINYLLAYLVLYLVSTYYAWVTLLVK